jgi:NitT/TauT family transport system substrate-binding protein
VDPTFTAATGSAALIAEVGAGQVDFGFSAATANVLQAVVKGAPVMMIGVQQSKSPTAVISRADKPINTPADLKGKKIAYGANTLGGVGLQVVLKENKISPNDVTVVNVQPTAYVSSLAQGAIDGYVSFSTSAFPSLEAVGVKPVQMPLRDYSFNPVPNDTYIASNSYIAKNPDAVKGFLAGTYDTWKYMAENADTSPAEAAKNCVGKHTGVTESLAAAQITQVLQLAADQLKQPDFMTMKQSDLQAQIDLLEQVGQLSGAGPAKNYYTNDFLPPPAG